MGVLHNHLTRRIKWMAVLLFLLTVSMLPSAHPALANDIQPYRIVANTDVVSAGYGGIRGNGTGSITVSGVSGTVQLALLYWHGPTNSTDPNANITVSFAGTDVSGTNIGFSSDNCWAFLNSQAYRADVTALVSGNGSYALSNFRKPNAEINGASLIVFFDDGDAANNRDIVLFDGNDSNEINIYDAPGWNLTLPGINYGSGTAGFELHVSDGQNSTFVDDAVVVNNVTVLPRGPIFSGNTVPNGPSVPITNGGLWDIINIDITNSLTPGNNTLNLRSGLAGDCLSLIVAAINLPVGAAPPSFPPPPVSPTEETGGEPAELWIAARPTPNYGATPGSLLSFEVQVANIGPGMAKDAEVVWPFNPEQVTVVDAVFSNSTAWVSELNEDSLVFRTGPIGSTNGVITGTIRLRVLDTVAVGSVISSQLQLNFSDRARGGDALSNTYYISVGEAVDNRETYSLEAGVNDNGLPIFGSMLFVPQEPVAFWFNTPAGEAVESGRFNAEDDGTLVASFDPGDLPAGTYTMVAYGTWSSFTHVATFVVE